MAMEMKNDVMENIQVLHLDPRVLTVTCQLL